MRDFKFRVWNKLSKKLIEWKDYKHVISGSDFNNDNLIITQYTGYKDVNGKEIYDKDIVLQTTRNSLGEKIKQFYWIEYKFGRYYASFQELRYATERIELSLLLLLNPVEVVGNVFENQDLLDD